MVYAESAIPSPEPDELAKARAIVGVLAKVEDSSAPRHQREQLEVSKGLTFGLLAGVASDVASTGLIDHAHISVYSPAESPETVVVATYSFDSDHEAIEVAAYPTREPLIGSRNDDIVVRGGLITLSEKKSAGTPSETSICSFSSTATLADREPLRKVIMGLIEGVSDTDQVELANPKAGLAFKLLVEYAALMAMVGKISSIDVRFAKDNKVDAPKVKAVLRLTGPGNKELHLTIDPSRPERDIEHQLAMPAVGSLVTIDPETSVSTSWLLNEGLSFQVPLTNVEGFANKISDQVAI